MSKTTGSRDGLSETFQEFLAKVARGLLGLGAFATLVATGLLVYTCFRVAADATVAKEALKNVGVLREVLFYGTVGVGVGASFLFWGEELASVALLLFGALLFFAPALVPMVVDSSNNTSAAALAALQRGGAVLGVVAVAVLVIEVVGKTRQRIKVGVKADGLKYGKGIKEEKDKQNVFLGKCWQLPFCRKFVRERCPIYHAKRTCWRERVGCMCEEEVIRVAMENKPIPKGQLLDGSAIPRNHRLTPKQKAERCKNCVIYNEHQRHKYKAVVPAILIVYLAFYAGLHKPLTVFVEAAIKSVNRAVGSLTFTGAANAKVPEIFVEALLFFIILLLLTYTMKLVEYLVFKLKI